MGNSKKDWRNQKVHRRAHRMLYDALPENKKLSREEIAEIRKFIADYKKNKKCSSCGESHPACLGFHHINKASKLFCISEAPRLGYRLETIIQELRKCEVLCHNCHAKLHWAEPRHEPLS